MNAMKDMKDTRLTWYEKYEAVLDAIKDTVGFFTLAAFGIVVFVLGFCI